MTETTELTAVLMDANDREQLMVIARNPDDTDLTWLQSFIARYDIARSFTNAAPERVNRLFACNPDESGGLADDDPKSDGWHSRRAELYDLYRPGK